MPQTPIRGYPYPGPNDAPDGSTQIRDLAEALEDDAELAGADIADLQDQVAQLGLVHIAHHAVTTSVGTVSLPGDVDGLDAIPQTFRDLIIVCGGKSTATSIGNRRRGLRCRVNGVSASDYRAQMWIADGSDSSVSNDTESGDYFQPGFFSSDDASDNFTGQAIVEFLDYAATEGRIMARFESWVQPGALTSEWHHRQGHVRMIGSAHRPITTVQFFCSTGDIKAGVSFFDIYGRGRR